MATSATTTARAKIRQLEVSLAASNDAIAQHMKISEELRGQIQRDHEKQWEIDKNVAAREGENRKLVKQALDIINYIHMDMAMSGDPKALLRRSGLGELKERLEQAYRA